MIDINKSIASAVKTGKVFFGANSAIQNAQTGKVKLIVLAANCPEQQKNDIEYYSKLSNVPVVSHKGSSLDLGAICGKPFAVSALSIREPGDSDILKLTEKEESEESMEGNE